MSMLRNTIMLGAITVFTAACDVDKTQDGKLPDVDVDVGKLPKYELKKVEEGRAPSVNVKGGQMPKYDVDTPDVDVDVDMPEEDDQ
ncbi:hypothetical protein TDB9533_00601 [Thalassocella blandensis]|nr:hypothetical protein TDB9533_00601 [Thalassocella blandensis]